MHFYVPTIGDSIFLSEPWTFTLHEEQRNLGLAKRIEQCGSMETQYHIYHNIRFKNTRRVENTWGNSYTIYEAGQTSKQYGIYNNIPFTLEGLSQRTGWNIEDLEDLGEVREPYTIFQWSGDRAEVTLPTGTELKVDRIYIKSTYRDFDSITFRIGVCPTNKKLSKARFWVKLHDANRIVCELHPVVDKQAPAASRFEFIEE